jgi:hypothetical protein
MKKFKINKSVSRGILAIFIAAFLAVFIQYELSLHYKHDENIHIYVECSPPDNMNCVDFTVKVNGKLMYHTDSIGACVNKYDKDIPLNVPKGINCIEYQSERLNFYHKEYVNNWLFIFSCVEISPTFNSARFSYFPIDLL